MEKINDKFDAMTRLIKAIPTIRNNYGGGRATNNQWPRFVADPHCYCWSSGYIVDKRHNGVTRNKIKDGHQEAATRSNPMGGNQVGKLQWWKGGRT
eukprot:10595812-Ditylum_brightwellii.AAC.1